MYFDQLFVVRNRGLFVDARRAEPLFSICLHLLVIGRSNANAEPVESLIALVAANHRHKLFSVADHETVLVNQLVITAKTAQLLI